MKFGVILILFTILMGGAAMTSAAESASSAIPKLKKLSLETPLGEPGTPRALIVAPQRHTTLAADLQSRIEEATGVRLPVFDDREALRSLDEGRQLILLGHFGTNKVIEHFYYKWCLVVDGIQPGKGGYVLQTVPGNFPSRGPRPHRGPLFLSARHRKAKAPDHGFRLHTRARIFAMMGCGRTSHASTTALSVIPPRLRVPGGPSHLFSLKGRLAR